MGSNEDVGRQVGIGIIVVKDRRVKSGRVFVDAVIEPRVR